METTKTSAVTLPQLLRTDAIKQRFNEVLGKNSVSFISSILTLYKDNDKFKNCDPNSIIAAAGTAALLKLPILPQLGYAYILPYGNKATFQIGYKGLIQIAIRSGLYKTINTTDIVDGEIISQNRITGDIILGERLPGKTVAGYVAYMELVTGFSKNLYMTVDDIKSHAEKYSKSYAYDLKNGKKESIWSTNFDAMAKKTVLKLLLSKYAPISIETQNNPLAIALKADSAAITKETYEYIDNNGDTLPRDDFNQFAPEPVTILETEESKKNATRNEK